MWYVFAFKSFAQSERQGRHLDDTIPFLAIYLEHDGVNETSKYLKFSSELFILMEFLHKVKGISSDKADFGTLDDKLITDFLNWLETECKYSVATRNQRLSAIAAFSIYAQNRDFGSAAAFRNCVLKDAFRIYRILSTFS